jgi:hypothetical protein
VSVFAVWAWLGWVKVRRVAAKSRETSIVVAADRRGGEIMESRFMGWFDTSREMIESQQTDWPFG